MIAAEQVQMVKMRVCLSPERARMIMLPLMLSAQQKWRWLKGAKPLVQVTDRVQFRNGVQRFQRAA